MFTPGNPRVFHFPHRSTPNVHPGKIVKSSKNIQDPQRRTNDYDRIQNRLNGVLHGDESIHQPEHKTDHHEDNHYLQ
jgi:hypothetical protein